MSDAELPDFQFLLTDSYTLSNYVPPARMGWTCPRCHRGVSPDVSRCPCRTSWMWETFPTAPEPWGKDYWYLGDYKITCTTGTSLGIDALS